MKKKYDTSKYIYIYISLAYDVMFTQMLEKRGDQTVLITRSCVYDQRVPTIKLWTNACKAGFGANS